MIKATIVAGLASIFLVACGGGTPSYNSSVSGTGVYVSFHKDGRPIIAGGAVDVYETINPNTAKVTDKDGNKRVIRLTDTTMIFDNQRQDTSLNFRAGPDESSSGGENQVLGGLSYDVKKAEGIVEFAQGSPSFCVGSDHGAGAASGQGKIAQQYTAGTGAAGTAACRGIGERQANTNASDFPFNISIDDVDIELEPVTGTE